MYILIAALTAAIVLPFAVPYRAGFADSSLAQRRLAIDTFGDAVHVRDYLTPPSATLAGTRMPENPYVIWGENTLYIGYVPLLLARCRNRSGPEPRPRPARWRAISRLSGSAGKRRRAVDAYGLALIAAGYILALGFVSPGLAASACRCIMPPARGRYSRGLRATQRFSLVFTRASWCCRALGLALDRRGTLAAMADGGNGDRVRDVSGEVFPFRCRSNPSRPYVPSPHGPVHRAVSEDAAAAAGCAAPAHLLLSRAYPTTKRPTWSIRPGTGRGS